jgi:hypothetical protein
MFFDLLAKRSQSKCKRVVRFVELVMLRHGAEHRSGTSSIGTATLVSGIRGEHAAQTNYPRITLSGAGMQMTR